MTAKCADAFKGLRPDVSPSLQPPSKQRNFPQIAALAAVAAG